MVLFKPPGAYELKFLKEEIKRIFVDEEHYTDSNYPFTIKPNFSTLGSILTISIQGPIITFQPDDNIRIFLGFNKTTVFAEYSLLPNPVDILSFDNLFLESNIAQGMIFRSKIPGVFHNFTMDVGFGYKYIEKFREGVQ